MIEGWGKKSMKFLKREILGTDSSYSKNIEHNGSYP